MDDIPQYGTATEVSVQLGIARTTLISAAHRGEIDYDLTLGGTMLICLQSAQKWSEQTRPMGRPPRPKQE